MYRNDPLKASKSARYRKTKLLYTPQLKEREREGTSPAASQPHHSSADGPMEQHGAAVPSYHTRRHSTQFQKPLSVFYDQTPLTTTCPSLCTTSLRQTDTMTWPPLNQLLYITSLHLLSNTIKMAAAARHDMAWRKGSTVIAAAVL